MPQVTRIKKRRHSEEIQAINVIKQTCYMFLSLEIIIIIIQQTPSDNGEHPGSPLFTLRSVELCATYTSSGDFHYFRKHSAFITTPAQTTHSLHGAESFLRS